MRLLSTTLIVLFSITAFSQQPLASINVDGSLDDLQAFASGDSLFVTYRDKQSKSNGIHAMWIDANGKVNIIPFLYPDNARLCAITKDGDLFYHFLMNKDGKALLETQVKGWYKDQPYEIKGTIISLSEQNGKLAIVSYEKTTNRITVAFLVKGVLSEEKSFEAPSGMKKFIDESGGALSVDQQLTSIVAGAGRLKVFFNEQDVIITMDEHLVKKAGTTVLKLDWATATAKVHFTPGVNFRRFASFYHDDLLYRYTLHRDSLELSVTHWETEALISRSMIRGNESLKKNVTYAREGKIHRAWNATLYNLVHYGTEVAFDPCLLVQTLPGTNNFRVLIGTYYNDKGAGSIAGVPNPFVMLATFVVTHAVRQLNDGPGLAHYFTMTGNPKDGFSLEPVAIDQPNSIRQVIDNHEIKRTNPDQSVDKRWDLYLKQTQYVSMPYGAVGLYEEKVKKDRRLIILKYDTPE